MKLKFEICTQQVEFVCTLGMMINLFRKIKLNSPILLIEHDMDAVFALADRISVIVYGKIVATGTVEEIRSNSLVREVYLGYEMQ